MTAYGWLLVLLLATFVVLAQVWSSLGRVRACQFGAGGAFLLVGGWLLWTSSPFTGRDRTDFSAPPATSESCFKCHENHFASWHQSYHRTMTREATPEYVKGDFHDATFTYAGITSRMTREGDEFFMETADPAWTERMLQTGKRPEDWGPPVLQKFKVDRLVGSHWFQECMHKEPNGRYIRLPLSYHIVEQRWIHTNGAFLAPDTDDFWSKSTPWNESCLFCHNTKPSKRPVRGFAGQLYRSQVNELGIACEACHGPTAEHIRLNRDPARRFAVRYAGRGDETIVNPLRLSVERADAICAHCHAGHVPNAETWDRETVTDPFNAGDDLFWAATVFWSEADQKALFKGQPALRTRPEPLDGRFWGDGTPLTTALEYQGMALSACYEGGHGKMKCVSCHSMHQGQPHFQLNRGMESNDACYQCHDSYRDRLVEHTHHPAGSSASLCYNCHMPYQVYSLLDTHRSHRIAVPRVKDSLGTGKPHACNLCHLDKSLGWTQDQLGQWYRQAPEPLSDEEKNYSSALLHLCQSDARSRVVVAGAFSWPPARDASGSDWQGPLLTRILDEDRFPAVRYLGYRGLRSLYGLQAGAYDYLARPSERKAQLDSLGPLLRDRCRTRPEVYPNLPLTPDGRWDDAVLNRLLQKRKDPDVVINE